jgi:tetratricopeptide (TPR) repeat protein
VRAVLLALLVACGGPKTPPQLPPLPHAAYAAYLDGKLAGARDDWPAAVDALTDAAKAAPDQPMIAVELARAQVKAKRIEAARQTLATARGKWPEHPQVWLASGDVEAQRAVADAIKFYKRAISIEPGEERAYLGLAKLEQPAAATRTLRQLVERVPTSIEGHYRLGQRLALADDVPKSGRSTRHGAGDVAGALAQFRKVLELDPDHIDARLDLSRGLRMQGNLDEAVAQARSAFDRSGQALDLAEELYNLLLEADDRVGAIDLLTLLDDDRSDVDALAAIARLDRGLGRLDEARAIAERIGRTDPALATLVLAEIDIAAGDPAAGARRALTVAADSERADDAHKLAASAWLTAGEPQRALAAIAPVRTHKPKDIDAATTAAFALVDLGKVADARAQLAAMGTELAVVFALARVEDRAGNPPGALVGLERLLAQKPDFVSALNLAGYLLADSNQRMPDAERYLRRARQLAPGDPAIMDSWGWLLYRKGAHRDAVRMLDHAARLAPREPEILLHLAAAWIADGAPKTAAATLARATALHPAPAVARKIEELRKTLPK